MKYILNQAPYRTLKYILCNISSQITFYLLPIVVQTIPKTRMELYKHIKQIDPVHKSFESKQSIAANQDRLLCRDWGNGYNQQGWFCIDFIVKTKFTHFSADISGPGILCLKGFFLTCLFLFALNFLHWNFPRDCRIVVNSLPLYLKQTINVLEHSNT